MQTQIDFKECEKALNYSFKNKNLLFQCFTHASYANEHKNVYDNERLEFFGDSILGFIVTEYLFDKYQQNEGSLTAIKQKIVSKKPLAKASIHWGFDKFLMLGEGEKRQTANSRESLCENLFESIVASIYIDGGLKEAKRFVFDKLISILDFENQTDSKSEFQEYVQKRKLGEIEYVEVSVSGPAHKPVFTFSVSLNGKILATESGSSKQEAQKKCALTALKKLK